MNVVMQFCDVNFDVGRSVQQPNDAGRLCVDNDFSHRCSRRFEWSILCVGGRSNRTQVILNSRLRF